MFPLCPTMSDTLEVIVTRDSKWKKFLGQEEEGATAAASDGP